ncbi:MAG: tetratricopeptide repeat protein [Candidatus Viridilinea halotolerans]|uniref:Tetratricopeptide repeat protein n=1 Tax=Candidatus Viridilinea halotolerans TaxID=2491704 RepID=A0A426UC21_9CHLR|nr:MAG: tetratricopeptide repeat protein [Candidatus Viridilinea halotolerans]
MSTDLKAEADALIDQGRVLLERGDLPKATDLLNQAVRHYWNVGEYYAAAAQTGNYGWALRRRGRPDLARPYLEQAADLFSQIGLAEFAERHRLAAEDAHSGLTPELLASMPTHVRAALERGDGHELQLALDALNIAERQIVIERLTAAGVIRTGGADDEAAEALEQFAPLLADLAMVARGDASNRPELEQTLHDLERKGWQLRDPVLAIWAGERDVAQLTQGLDPLDQALVKQVLALL